MTKLPFMQWIGLGLLGIVLASCSGLAGEPNIVATLPPVVQPTAQAISLPQTAPIAAAGAQVYEENCTRCHGVSGKGDGELVQSGQVTGVADFTDPQTAQDTTPIQWFEVVTNGRLDKLMPPWGDKLTEAQRWDVTMYVYTLANSRAQIEHGKTIWDSQCAECHGTNGEGTENAKQLTNLLESSNADLLKSLSDVSREAHQFTDSLLAEDRVAVIAYVRSMGTKNVPVEVANSPTAEANTNPAPAATEDVSSPAAVVGTISGKISNLSAGGTVPEDLSVNLHIISDQNISTQGDILPQKIDPNGTYRFENVPIQLGWQYVVTTTYKDAAFNSEVVEGDPANSSIELPLSIYDVAADPAAIKIDAILTMVQAQPENGVLDVIQIYNFTNASDRIYMRQDGETPTSVSVRVPTGAMLQDFSGGEYLISADGRQVVDTKPIIPGVPHVMHIAFTLPYSDNAIINQSVDYSLDGQVEVLVSGTGMTVAGEGFEALGERQLGQRSYMSYGGNLSLNAGESINYAFNGSETGTQAAATSASSTVSPVAYVLIGAGLLAIGAAFGFFLRERQPRVTTPKEINISANTLIKRIAELDVQYNEGKLAEAKYQKQRASLKAELVAAMKDKAGSD